MILKKILILVALSLFTNTIISQESVEIKDTGFADTSIRIKTNGFGDISVRFTQTFADITVGFTDRKYKADFILKHSGFADRSVRIKKNGLADITIVQKDIGQGDVSIQIKDNGIVDYLIYSDKDTITKAEIIAALINIIKKKADYED
ncbi:hypothetical protein [Pontimicrobium sp. MEBiC01747]